MIVLSSIDGAQRYASPASERLTGYTPEEYLALDRSSLVHPEDRAMVDLFFESVTGGKLHHRLRYRLTHKTGGWRWVEVSTTAFLDSNTGAVDGYVGTVRDITQIQVTERERDHFAHEREQFRELSNTDPLTQLPNRRAFDEAMNRQIMASLASGQQAALLLIDVDNFKRYNDTYGHEAGDRCLAGIGVAMRRALGRDSDFLARWGGEEFVVLLSATRAQGAQKVAADILRAVRSLQITHEACARGHVTVSIGIAPLDDNALEDASSWIQKADRALYESKRLGKDQARMTPAAYAPEEALAS
jgi:diguanylate cyclase (GGDEF)-like protein/PAS domain S-box-containing protein